MAGFDDGHAQFDLRFIEVRQEAGPGWHSAAPGLSRAARLEVLAHTGTDEAAGSVLGPRHDCVQGRYERSPLLIVGALGEQLFELDRTIRSSPMVARRLGSPGRSAPDRLVPARAAWRTVTRTRARIDVEPRRTLRVDLASFATTSAARPWVPGLGAKRGMASAAASGRFRRPAPRTSAARLQSDDLRRLDPDTAIRPLPCKCSDMSPSAFVSGFLASEEGAVLPWSAPRPRLRGWR